jgi:hypothetical protein
MLAPKRVRYRKQQKGRMRGAALRGNTVSFGDYGLQALECGWITSRQIEAARIALTRYVKRTGNGSDSRYIGSYYTIFTILTGKISVGICNIYFSNRHNFTKRTNQELSVSLSNSLQWLTSFSTSE